MSRIKLKDLTPVFEAVTKKKGSILEHSHKQIGWKHTVTGEIFNGSPFETSRVSSAAEEGGVLGFSEKPERTIIEKFKNWLEEGGRSTYIKCIVYWATIPLFLFSGYEYLIVLVAAVLIDILVALVDIKLKL